MQKKIYAILFLSILMTACGGGKQTKVVKKPAPPVVERSVEKVLPSSQQKTAKPNTQIAKTPDIGTPTPSKPSSSQSKSSSGGGYYLDDGPHANPPSNLGALPDATPRLEPINVASTRPYKALGKKYYPMKTRIAFTEKGNASWYGKRFHGRKTANGEIYDMYAMTAAHKTVPLPSYARVTNPANQRSVIVRVNDRGPFKTGRIVDLSYAAAKRIGIIQQGSAPVIFETIDPNTYQQSTAPTTRTVATQPVIRHTGQPTYYIQTGAFSSLENVHKQKMKILNAGIEGNEMFYHVYNNGLYKLRLGPYATQQKAKAIAAKMQQQLQLSTIINTQ